MKKIIICLFLLCSVFINAYAQNISLKSVSLKQSDLRASTYPRTDSNGKTCAIVKVDVIGVKDLTFTDAVGDVVYNLGEYVVYVPEGIRELKYSNTSGSISGVVNFDDYGLEIETKRVYSVVFESSNHFRAAIFSIQPQNATLVFDGKEVSLDENGLVSIEKPVGTYHYSVSAKGHESLTDSVTLTEDDIFTTTNVVLKQKLYPLHIDCNYTNATLYIDNVPYGSLDKISELKVPEGEHVVRLTSTGCDDYEQLVNIEGKPSEINVTLTMKQQQVVKYTKERTRTRVNIRNGLYPSIGFELYDEEKYMAHTGGIKGELTRIQHFGGIFALRGGAAIGIMPLDKDLKYEKIKNISDSTDVSWFLEIPLQLGISIPFGDYNKHLFSIFAGGYGKNFWVNEKIHESKSKKIINQGKGYWDYGLRFGLQVDISHFSIAGEYSKSHHSLGKIYGLRISYKFDK